MVFDMSCGAEQPLSGKPINASLNRPFCILLGAANSERPNITPRHGIVPHTNPRLSPYPSSYKQYNAQYQGGTTAHLSRLRSCALCLIAADVHTRGKNWAGARIQSRDKARPMTPVTGGRCQAVTPFCLRSLSGHHLRQHNSPGARIPPQLLLSFGDCCGHD